MTAHMLEVAEWPDSERMAQTQRYHETRNRVHGSCRLCGQAEAGLPQLDFSLVSATRLCAEFSCGSAATGYQGLVHGGIAAAICDAAMCNALFAQGIQAYTARLELRYRSPLRLGATAVVTADYLGRYGSGWQLRAEIVQGARVIAAQAVFLASKEET
ncbi:MAG: hotdog fold domain-containing protein [Planctomycetota bacterium]|nr:hotdog fold domain-containing protein [Planctomycetota bacterium]